MPPRSLGFARSLAFAVSLVVAVSCVAARPAAAQTDAAPSRNTLLVFDGSGSMWGQIEGDKQAKFVLVREALRKSLASPPAGTRLGMLSFGYRRQGDCSDVGVLTQLEPLTAETMTERVMTPLEKINPKGKGPLTAALREAARMIGKTPAPRSLVVVHDGADNCGLNPCDIVAELKDAAPGVAIHVVGLALDEAEAKKYQCLATATGGTHYDVRTAADVGPAIDAATRLALGALAPSKPQSAAAPPAAPQLVAPPKPVDLAVDGPPHLRLRALMASDKPFAAQHRLRWSIRPEGDKTGVAIAEPETQDALIPIPAGRYVVTLEDGFARAEKAVAAPAKGHLLVEVALDAGVIDFAAEQAGTLLTIYRRDDGAQTMASAPQSSSASTILPGRIVGMLPVVPRQLTLPAGAYVLRIERGNRRTDLPVTVAAAGLQSLPPARTGTIEVTLSQRLAADGKDQRGARPVVLTVEEDDPLSPRGRREVARSAAVPATFSLPPGSYTLVAAQGPLEIRERIAITAGERVRRTLPVAASRLLLAMRGPTGEALGVDGQRVWYRIERRDATGVEPLYAFESNSVVDLPPGRYGIVGHSASATTSATSEIEISAGETRAVVLTLPGGTLVLQPGPKFAGEVSWQVTDTSGARRWISGQGPQSVTLPSGRYAVRATSRDQVDERTVEVLNGKRQIATLGD